MQGEVFVVFWNVKRLGEGTDREKSALSEPFVDVFSKVGQPDTAYQSPEAASQATWLTALDALVTTLSDRAIFDFDPLSRLTRSSLLFAVLRLFPRGGLDDLYAWKHARPRRRHGDYDTPPRPRSRAGSSMVGFQSDQRWLVNAKLTQTFSAYSLRKKERC
ncbi:hypothetical protein EDB85DRAFT_2230056 [Lactarius pseudohatsudake]|nr:hypothetical protein EDB85DRAFT_2230056 [Lactarius pseudohatsudake]